MIAVVVEAPRRLVGFGCQRAREDRGPRTLRERIDLHTGEGTCGARCHGTMINPIGFAFENYDQLGRWRTEDNGLPVDAAAEYDFSFGAVDRRGQVDAYDDAVGLAGVLADQAAVHDCYTGHWLSYLYGRNSVSDDGILVRRVAAASRAGELDLRELIASLVTTDAFLARTNAELEDVTEEP